MKKREKSLIKRERKRKKDSERFRVYPWEREIEREWRNRKAVKDIVRRREREREEKET